MSPFLFSFSSQHTRFVQECKDAEPDVLFIGDSMIQLMQHYDVRQDVYLFKPAHLTSRMALVSSYIFFFLNCRIIIQNSRYNVIEHVFILPQYYCYIGTPTVLMRLVTDLHALLSLTPMSSLILVS